MIDLEIPNELQIKGLYIFCNKCKSKTKSYLIPNTNCNHPSEKQVFKIIITIPGTKGVRTCALSTRDVNEAIKKTRDYVDELKSNDYQQIKEKSIFDFKPQDLLHAMAMYKDFMKNGNVHRHQIRIRSKAHIQQVEIYLDRFIDSLIEKNIKVGGLLLRNINDHHVSAFYSYLESKPFKNRTFNRHLDTVSEFFNYLIELKHYTLVNYFSSKNIIRKRVNPRVDSVSIKEFKEMQNIISPNNGMETLSTGENKYHYFDWLNETFELGLYTGFRREAIVNLKFSNIFEQDGKPIYVECEDFKYNLKNNLFKEEEKKYIYAPIIKDLLEFLEKSGYEQYKGTDRYIIAPNSTKKRATIKNDMSKSFTHYYSQLNTGKKLSFKHLRKTYITHLNIFTNNKAEVITGHSGQGIIMKSYQDPKVFNDVLINFKLIG